MFTSEKLPNKIDANLLIKIWWTSLSIHASFCYSAHSVKDRSGSRTETLSQVGTHRTSNRGSIMDLHVAENPPIPEESSHKEQESPS